MGKLENNKRYREKLKEYSGYGIIYRATCLLDNKIYIGQTIRSLRERISEHSKRGQFYIHSAIKKHGSQNFRWEIIFIADSEKDLDYAETYLIRYYQSDIKGLGYNLTSGGDHPVFTEESKKKISDKMIGNKNHRFGTRVSIETKKKMSESHRKRKKEGRLKLPDRKKPIKCLETSKEYQSVTQASIDTKIPARTLTGLLSSGKKSRKHLVTFIYINQ